MRRGISLVEVVVSIAILALLMAILLPAIQWGREASRRLQCANHLKQLGLAVTNYESQFGIYPWGLVHKYQLLPFLDQQAVFDLAGTMDPVNPDLRWQRVMNARIPVYLCPTDPAPASSDRGRGTYRVGPGSKAMTSYAACFGSGVLRDGFNGMFNKHPISSEPYISPPVRAADVTDGLSNTVAMSEFLHANWSGGTTMERMRTVWSLPDKYSTAAALDSMANECARVPPDPIAYGWNGSPMKLGFTWWDGNCGIGMYNHVLEPNRPSCWNGNGIPHLGVITAASLHTGGVNAVYGDGHVSFISSSIDREVWREMGSRIRQNMGTMP